jgi:DNA repair photolyase
MLKMSTGNMYEFITHTWNPIVGRCPHDCKYCYVLYKYGNKIDGGIRLNEECFKDDFGSGKFIFVGSGVDLFAKDIPDCWIKKVLDYCYRDNTDLFGTRNRFLFQSKNPRRMLQFIDHPIFLSSVACTTIESNRYYPSIMNHAPHVEERALAMNEIANRGVETYLTIEPIMDFEEEELVRLVKMCRPAQVNIGANTNANIKLPEPTKHNILKLVAEIGKECKVDLKSNLERLIT